MGGVIKTPSSLSINQGVNLPITVKPTNLAAASDFLSQPPEGGVIGFSATDQLTGLKGKTIELRSLTPADYEDYKAAIERNSDHLQRGSASNEFLHAAVASPEAFEMIWQLSEQARALGTDFSFGVFEDDELIGEVALNAIRRGPYESAFLSAWIDKARVGQNKVEEAFVLLCRFAFDTLALNRVECAVLPDHEAVQHALKKVGVSNEGTARDYMMSDGEFKDHLRYVITSGDWKKRGADLLSEWAGI